MKIESSLQRITGSVARCGRVFCIIRRALLSLNYIKNFYNKITLVCGIKAEVITLKASSMNYSEEFTHGDSRRYKIFGLSGSHPEIDAPLDSQGTTVDSDGLGNRTDLISWH